jgi:phosphoserine phosphatase
MLGDETVVRSGGVVLSVKNLRPHLGLVSEETASQILEVLRGLMSGRTIGEIVGLVSVPHVRFHVAWLLKQGYLEVVGC